MLEVEIESLRDQVELRPDGSLWWKKGAQGRKLHKPAFSTETAVRGKSGARYLCGMIDGVRLLAHRVVWALAYGSWPDGWIDHINGDTRDNRPENLRLASPGLSNHNRRYKNTSSKYIGVTYHAGKYTAQIQYQNKHYHLGWFASEEEAAKVRDARAKELYGKDAQLNFP